MEIQKEQSEMINEVERHKENESTNQNEKITNQQENIPINDYSSHTQEIIKIQTNYKGYLMRLIFRIYREKVIIIQRNLRQYFILKKDLPDNYYANLLFLSKEENNYQINAKENVFHLFNPKRKKEIPQSLFYTKIVDFDLMISTDECYNKSWGELMHQIDLYYTKQETSIQQISLGSQHTLCLNNKGCLSSFGWNNYGQCGKEIKKTVINKDALDLNSSHSQFLNTIETINEIKSTTNSSFVSVSSGEDHSLLIDDNGVLWGFGLNLNGQLGQRNPKIVQKPTRINDFFDQNIVCAQCNNNLSFVVNAEGEGFMWPWEDKFGKIYLNPRKFKLPNENEKITNISCGNNFVFLLSKTGNVYSMGKNNKYGQLGHQDKKPRYHPIIVDFFSRNQEKINQISCGFNHVIAKNINGKVFTWGMGIVGQLGQGSLVTELSVPHEIKMPEKTKKIYQVSAGFRSSYFLTENGKIYMCGYNGSIRKQFFPIECIISVKYPEIKKETNYICRINNCWNKSFSVFYVTFINIGLIENSSNIQKIKNLSKLISLKWLNQSNSYAIMKEFINCYDKN